MGTSPRGRGAPGAGALPVYFWPAAIGIVCFAIWTVWLVFQVRQLRAGVERHVGALVDVRAAADLATGEVAPDSARDWAEIDRRVRRAGRDLAGDPALAEQVAGLRAAIDELKRATEAGTPTDATRGQVVAAQSRLVRTLRGRTAAISAELGDKWTSLYLLAGAVLLLATANLVLMVVAFRRRRAAEAQRAELAAHMAILESTASAIADGAIDRPVEGSDAFATTLERIRSDLVGTIDELDRRNRENQELNRELRHQIRERSRELDNAIRKLRGDPGGLADGDLVADRYRVAGALGSGSHGMVYRVTRESDGRELALKLLKHGDSDLVVQRFIREAQLLAEIRHPNVITVHDVGLSDSGQLYLVTELIEGASLRELRERYRDVDWGLPILAAAASGLAAVHEHGVVHRDVKPGNILVASADDQPAAKLIDFGIAHLAARPTSDWAGSEPGSGTPTRPRANPSPPADDPSATPDTASLIRTRVGMVVGTPRYLAPEVASASGEIRAATDVFALGVTGYLILTGKRPFPQPPLTLVARYGELPPPTPVAVLNDAVPSEAAAVIMRCLDAAPELRPSAADVAAAIAG